ncbi:MAG: DUF3656 domain-containing protein [Clostridia bacterium]|nr:DUF3656 domain-containing protein [Clostridia bacterium]
MDSRDNGKLELLAPAGSMESLVAALSNGADAVYMGGGDFNARRNARNFDDSELRAAIARCRLLGKRCYITVNTLLFERELEAAFSYCTSLYEYGADALIVQDMGLIRELRRRLPELELHASTQLGVHNADGLAVCRELGLARAVLAREVSVDAIRELSALDTGVELEAFAHGALCMSFSGACLYSSMAGERSGNRGLCAQPCRKRARLDGVGERALSPMDLCMIEHIGSLREAGVRCIKLEGRMKRAEYVAAVTRAYRKAIDAGGAPPEDVRAMHDVFSRGFTTGYYFGDGVRVDARSPESAPARLYDELARTYADGMPRMPLELNLKLRANEPAQLTAQAGAVRLELVGERAQEAHAPRDPKTYERLLGKLNDTPFAAADIRVDADGAYLAAADVNALRRAACAAIEASVRRAAQPRAAERGDVLRVPAHGAPELIAIVRTEEQADAAIAGGVSTIAVAPRSYDEDAAAPMGARYPGALLYLPVTLLSRGEREVAERLLTSGAYCGIVANNICHMALGRGMRIVAGAHMNVTNNSAALALRELGASLVTLSVELTSPQLRDICAMGGCAVYVYGHQPLMHLTHCPKRELSHCDGCRGHAAWVTDEENRRFELTNTIICGRCSQRLLNMVPTYLIDKALGVGASAWVLEFDTEPGERVRSIAEAAVRAAAGAREVPVVDGYTRGHFNRQVD